MGTMKKKRDYEGLARASYEASQNMKFPLPLRQYYAAVALWADKKSTPTER